MSASETPSERRARHFFELCDLDESARRTALARLALEDSVLAADVEQMLALDLQDSEPLEALRAEVADAAQHGLLGEGFEEPPPPAQLGAWRLGEKLGAGGMGEVWAAERIEGGFSQQAAVKLVRSSMASREVVARFAVERQLLARLNHPSIARLYDGGIAADGRPWFAMERIDGLPITRFATERELALEARLRLLLTVMQAVEFAHRNLIVHRDLKPSNILVAPDGAARLLDFGLAKLLEARPDSGVETHATRTELRALTPAYAAPEQILGQPVTTATDVYSLGVILYELLTGELPHRRDSSSPSTLAAGLAHEIPGRPSQQLRKAAEKAGQDASRAARRLAGDLDTIALKALARESERRYASVAAFAADLEAHLERRPITARADSAGYRLSRFVRRHRIGVAAALVVLASLLGGLSVSIRQTRRANAAAVAAGLQAQRAERVKGFLVSVFEQADPTRTLGAAMPARQILEEGARRLETELRDEPEVRAELFDAVARIQVSLGLLDEGLASAERAAAERGRLFGGASLERAVSLTTIGNVLLAKGKPAEAGARFHEAIGVFELRGDRHSVAYANALSGRAQTRLAQGDLVGSVGDQRRACELVSAALGENAAETLEQLSVLAVLETGAGTFAEAARTFRQILARLEPAEGRDSAKVLEVVLNLATALDSAGENAEALRLFERVVAGRRKIYGHGHPALAEALIIASLRLSRAGRNEDAILALAEARATYAPADHPELASVDNYTGLVLAELGRFSEAEQAFERSSRRFAKNLGADNLLTLNALANKASALSEQGRYAEAEEAYERSLDMLRTLGEFDNPRLLRARFSWGANLRKLGRHSQSREVLQAAHELALLKLGREHLRIAECQVELARLDLAEGGPGASASARARLAAAEAIAAKKTLPLSLTRNLAAAKAELARRAG